ncbi:MAG TPA: hypothetical protein VKA86_14255 [Candidatus Krumholzibacteria bacterium]|nr:hypothetical protein [Candidatus Krumholzibacteria bacterium]
MSGESIFPGLSLEEALLVIAAVLVVVDVFVAADFPTLVAYVAVAAAIGMNIDADPRYRWVGGALVWLVLVVFHFSMWRKLVTGIVNRWIAPTRIRSVVESMVGECGTARRIKGHLMIDVQGELWSVHECPDLEDGQRVRVDRLVDGRLKVSRIES